ncbi:hypothetical protein BMS3Abin07_01677 [bacterium BMS3Abin07]|nr:hypothetical protein BMS3Abin07_01677 [bacterium BMS3Abin07]GBE32262.1 hypothetical protein BMS3Bbin05_01171 [bacterium BMS3Bbin05]HDO22134.1 hypothetical protein [Nitrospirota bacterium]HDZ87080.1 hypothetical protein [Nitrospirota bacterium]
MASRELTISLSDEILKEIESYKKSTNRSTEAAIAELIKYALTLPLHFRDFDWVQAESEADKEIAAGRIKSFDSIEEFLSDLNK